MDRVYKGTSLPPGTRSKGAKGAWEVKRAGCCMKLRRKARAGGRLPCYLGLLRACKGGLPICTISYPPPTVKDADWHLGDGCSLGSTYWDWDDVIGLRGRLKRRLICGMPREMIRFGSQGARLTSTRACWLCCLSAPPIRPYKRSLARTWPQKTTFAKYLRRVPSEA